MSKVSKLKPTLNSTDLELLSNYFATKDEIEEIIDKKMSEKVGKLPTKKEYYERSDEMMGELKAIREEQAVLNQHDQDQSDRLDRLDLLHSNTHPHFLKS